jgi:PAS domain S-box-containing protein
MSDREPTADAPPGEAPAADHAVGVSATGAATATAVARAAVAIAREPDETRIPQRIVDEVVETLGARSAGLFVLERPGVLRLVAHRALDRPAVERLARVSLDDPLPVARAARARELQVVADLGDETTAEPAGLSGPGFAAPLVAHGRLQGVLAFARPWPGPVPDAERETVAAVADLFALALAEARAREGRRGQRVQLEALRRAALAIAEASDLSAVLQTIVEQARLVAGAEYGALGIVAGPDVPFEPWVFVGLGPEEERTIGPHPRPRGLLGAVPAEGRSIRIPDLFDDPRFEGFPAGHPRMHAFLGVPIRHGDGIIGNLYLTNKIGRPGTFTAEDQHAIEILARHAGIAVQQARTRERLEREIDERRRSEEALRRSETRLARAQELARLGSWELEPESGQVVWSAEMFRILGHEPGAFEPSLDRFLAAVAPTEREPVGAAVLRMIESGEPLRFQTRIVRPDGTERVIVSEGRALAADGRARRIVGTLQDITARIRAEEERVRLLALAEERSWLRTVIERSPVGILLFEGRDAPRLLANRRAEELLGRAVPAPRPGLLLRPDRSPVEPEEFPSSRALAGGTVNAEEFVLVRPDGGELPILASAAPIRDAVGDVVGAVVTIEDITPLKELARLRDEWTSVVAHDLRQPVTTVSAYGALLARHPDPTVRTRAGHVLAAARRLDRMIADLLDVSRLEAHRMSLDLQPVELAGLLRDVAERTAVEHGAGRFAIDVPAALPPVRADPARLEQVLSNLLSNAVKYGFADTPIRLSARADGDRVEIAVENRGPGIAPADLPRLFQRFQRGRRVARVTGIGLGLYIARGIVEAHGGQIRAESVPGETTVFRFTLPIAAAPAA